jgi:hypothetical protein
MDSLSCENIVLWRGHFNSTGQETSVNLSINGGEGNFCFLSLFNMRLTFNSICCQRMAKLAFPRYFIRKVCIVHLSVMRWVLIDRSSTNNRRILEETDDQFIFPTGSLIPGVDNVVTIIQVRGHAPVLSLLIDDVLQDNMGLNQTNGSRSHPLSFRTSFEPGKRYD